MRLALIIKLPLQQDYSGGLAIWLLSYARHTIRGPSRRRLASKSAHLELMNPGPRLNAVYRLGLPYDRYYCNDGVGSLFHSQNLPELQQVAADKGPFTRLIGTITPALYQLLSRFTFGVAYIRAKSPDTTPLDTFVTSPFRFFVSKEERKSP